MNTKEEAIRSLAEALSRANKVSDVEEVLRCALDRESQGSTAIGSKVAIPHTKCPAVRELSVSLGIIRPGLDWGAENGESCELIFFMAAPPGASGPHIQSLASLARLLKVTDLNDRLAQALTPDQAYEAIAEEEASLMLEIG